MKKMIFLFCAFLSCISLSAQTEWPIYVYDNLCSFRVPPTMELRDANSSIATLENQFNDLFNLSSENRIVFHQTGLNSTDVNVKKKISSLYARIIIECIPQDDINQLMVEKLTKTDLNKISEVWEQDTKQFFDSPEFKWFPLRRNKIGGRYALITKYIRPGAWDSTNTVMVEEFKFFLNGILIRFTLSYRMTESDTWKSDFSKIMTTLSFN